MSTCLLIRPSDAEDTELRFGHWGIEARRQTQRQNASRVGGVYHTIVPKACRCIVRMALLLVLLADWSLEDLFLFGAPRVALGLDAIALHGGQDTGRLFAAHHTDARVGPHPQKARRIRAAAHPVVSRAEAATDDHREFRNLSAS